METGRRGRLAAAQHRGRLPQGKGERLLPAKEEFREDKLPRECSATSRREPAVETSGTVATEGAPGDAGAADTPGGSTGFENGVYIVEQGDTLAIISQKAYGDISHVDAICRMNGLTDGNLIYIGQKLLLP